MLSCCSCCYPWNRHSEVLKLLDEVQVTIIGSKVHKITKQRQFLHLTQWTIIANPVGTDQPAKRQKKPSCVSTGRAGHVLCICQVAHRTSFLSRQCDVIASFSFGACTVQTDIFIVLIHPIQWTIANPIGADRPAKRQKKTSCVSTGRPVPVLCTHKVAHRTSFLSRQSDVIASFSFGACTVIF